MFGRGIAVSGDIQRRAFLPCFLFRAGGLAAGFFFTGAFALDLPFLLSLWRLEGGIMLLMHDFYAQRRFFSFSNTLAVWPPSKPSAEWRTSYGSSVSAAT